MNPIKNPPPSLDMFHTLLDFLRWGISQMNAHAVYFGHGTDNSEDEAMLMLATTLHLSYPINPEYLHARLTQEEKAALIAIFQRRIQERVPVPYLINKAWFAGLEFYVDERVLIPRSPVAELIEQGFSPWVEPMEVHRILDLCTGSACIAIACAYAFPEAHVDAVDISKDALAVADKNVRHHGCEDSLSLWESDLFSHLPSDSRYDIIISNPPYVSDEEFSGLPPEYHHEPAMALLTQKGSPDGLEIVNQILKQAKHYLNPKGILVVEVGNSQEALVQRYPDAPFLWLDFEKGGDGVFLLTAEQLNQIEVV